MTEIYTQIIFFTFFLIITAELIKEMHFKIYNICFNGKITICAKFICKTKTIIHKCKNLTTLVMSQEL